MRDRLFCPRWQRQAYENLVNAVIELAAIDYTRALIRLRKYPDEEESLRMIEECETFFLSRHFGILIDLDGFDFMVRLQDRADRLKRLPRAYLKHS